MLPESETEVVVACPASHRRLRRVLSAIIVALVVCLASTLIYLGFTGGLRP
ncbi:hypothetical protein IAD21_05915 [Abditibacteriota bacterium]|nr:hypothetical protein IAD21_05915 [Abditibacteriota bacterium]